MANLFTPAKGWTFLEEGSEAKLYVGNYLGRRCIAKVRFRKTRRYSQSDDAFTKKRIKRELDGLLRSNNIGVKAPTVYKVDGKCNAIYMEYMENAETVNVYVTRMFQDVRGTENAEGTEKLKNLAVHLGKAIGKLHSVGIMHGDLTTSNVLIVGKAELEDNSPPNLCFIDFGLTIVENGVENKAVDLHILERSLRNCTLSNISWFLGYLLESYRQNNTDGGEHVILRLKEVRSRQKKRNLELSRRKMN